MKKINSIISYFAIIMLGICLGVVINTMVIYNAYIPSESMEGTLDVGDRVLCSRLSYKNKGPERFDIIVFDAPDEPGTDYIKRVIGLPGETVEIREGKVYVNGSKEPLDDSFVNPEEPADLNYMEFEVPDGCYFVMGDNRNNSWDSRYWEDPYVPESSIIAKAVWKYWKGFKVVG